MVKTQDLWEYREFDRSLMPKAGNKHDHLEQVRHFILKTGFQEPIIISCNLKTGRAYITEGDHRLWMAIQEGIPFIPGGAGSELWNRVYMIAPVKKFGRVRLSTNFP